MSRPGNVEVEVTFLLTAEGGREQPVSLCGGQYRPHFVVGSGTYLGVAFVGGPDEAILPGSTATGSVAFMYEPAVNYDALVEGATFQVMEGTRVVATGRVVRRT